MKKLLLAIFLALALPGTAVASVSCDGSVNGVATVAGSIYQYLGYWSYWI